MLPLAPYLRLAVCLFCLGAAVCLPEPGPASADDEFPGWQAMRVFEQKGRPLVMRAADLDGNGGQELIVVNTRHSRLDMYRWLEPGERGPQAVIDPQRPNDLPLAPEFRRDELTLEHLPHDVVVEDLDGDGRGELIILVAPPARILVYGRDEQQQWAQRRREDLLEGDLAPRGRTLLTRRTAEGVDLLISTTEGVQRLSLGERHPPTWLTPREKSARIGWWLADLDADGDRDLVELTSDAGKSIRWYPCATDGHLMPAQVLFDRAVKDGCPLRSGARGAHLLLLDGATDGLLRRYKLSLGELSPLGRQRGMPLGGGKSVAWCGLQIGAQAALVVADRQSPRLMLHPVEEEGWEAQSTFPGIADVQAMVAPQAEPGTLLLQAKDGSDLLRSRWQNGRLTYPVAWPQSPEIEDRRILSVATVGTTTWWVQRVADDLDLYVWKADDGEPSRIRFRDSGGARADKALWLGGARLLVQPEHARHANLIALIEEQTKIYAPSHLEKVRYSELRLLDVGGRPRAARLTEGVLQWLDKHLQATDQVMLGEGRHMTGFLPLDKGRGWALDKEGRLIHLLEPDEAGIARVVRSIQSVGGIDLARDPVLGVMLIDHDRITQLGPGRPRELALMASIDRRMGRPSGAKEATIHRVTALDATGGGGEQVILFDDRRHQMTMLADRDGVLVPLISWPVFEDRKYPYAGEQAPVFREPRSVIALDMDADGRKDLALACHDRVLLYLARGTP
jgi:hypothetical protein